MNNKRRLEGHLDSLAAGRRIEQLPIDPEDAPFIRAAIILRSSRPGDDRAEERFIVDLGENLASWINPGERVNSVVTHPRRARTTLTAFAACGALLGGTIVATKTLTGAPSRNGVLAVPRGSMLRTATFEAPDHRVIGEIVVYKGNPSWIYMNLVAGWHQGSPVTCQLQRDNGSTVTVGSLIPHGGPGMYSRAIKVNVDHVRGATLLGATGAVVGTAIFT